MNYRVQWANQICYKVSNTFVNKKEITDEIKLTVYKTIFPRQYVGEFL